MELSWFVGQTFALTGVDISTVSEKTWSDQFEYCQVINFILDGITYSAIEDPNDGYRSSLKEVRITDTKVTNVFPPCTVRVEKCSARIVDAYRQDCQDDTILFIDTVTGKTVMEVGTSNADDYYPSYVNSFMPENMSCNMTANATVATPNPAMQDAYVNGGTW